VISKRLLTGLLGGVLVLPIAIVLVLGVARLLTAMGDAAGGTVLGWIALAGGILWGITMICLLVALGLHSLAPSDDSPRDSLEEP
jgi:hypothetical protein